MLFMTLFWDNGFRVIFIHFFFYFGRNKTLLICVEEAKDNIMEKGNIRLRFILFVKLKNKKTIHTKMCIQKSVNVLFKIGKI